MDAADQLDVLGLHGPLTHRQHGKGAGQEGHGEEQVERKVEPFPAPADTGGSGPQVAPSGQGGTQVSAPANCTPRITPPTSCPQRAVPVSPPTQALLRGAGSVGQEGGVQLPRRPCPALGLEVTTRAATVGLL